MVPWYAGRARRAHPVRGKGISHLDQFGNQTNLSPEEADDGRDREEFVMEYHRKQAKALVRAYRAGEREAVRRVEAILGDRARERPGGPPPARWPTCSGLEWRDGEPGRK